MELYKVEPDSREYAEALASLAEALWWAKRNDEARRVVEDAVAAADRSGLRRRCQRSACHPFRARGGHRR